MINTPRETFRLFVSSTFRDFRKERSALQERVFPRLRALCASAGAHFQAIDLRWGVSEEASLDQQTMNICLDEIRRCQQVTPRPNFLVLLGHRYGWRPLPPSIPAREFELILGLLSDADRALLGHWYEEDRNAVPRAYRLLPRERGDRYANHAQWRRLERRLHQALRAAVRRLNLDEKDLLKYEASATHQEIAAGALSVEDASEHVFGFIREIPNLPCDERAADFIEMNDQGKPDVDAQAQLGRLKDELRACLQGNLQTFEARWEDGEVTDGHLNWLCEQAYEAISGVIRRQLDRRESQDPLEVEIAQHIAFQEDRARFFTGREEYLAILENYAQGNQRCPLILWGTPGSGKSALLARAAQLARDSLPRVNVLTRFVGATPDSTLGTSLLKGLCEELLRILNIEEHKGRLLEKLRPESQGREIAQIQERFTIPDGYQALAQYFRQMDFLVDDRKPILIFIDALDQLSPHDPAMNLAWLPNSLPDQVRLIISTQPGLCLERLKEELPQGQLVELKAMKQGAGRQLLDRWLRHAGRRLQDDQERHVLDRFQDCPQPLYLRLAFEEARRWKSHSPQEETILKSDIRGLVREMLDRLCQETHHGKTLVSRTLGYLVAAKHGMTEDELLDVLAADESVMADFYRRSPESPRAPRLPVVIWARLLHDLAPYLTLRAADGANLLDFFHRQVEAVVMEIFLSDGAKAVLRRGLEGYFQRQSLWLEENGRRSPNLRKMTELPFQQILSERWDQAETTLSDVGFMYSKLTAVGTQDLLEDYRLALAQGCPSASMRLIHRALQLSAQVLRKDPAELPAQLTGRLLASEHPKVVAFLDRLRDQISFPWIRPRSPALAAAGGPLEMIIGGHPAQITALAVTCDSRYLITGSKDIYIRIFDLQSGMIHHSWAAGGRTRTLALTSDNQYLISGTESGKVFVWDLPSRIRKKETGNPLYSLNGPPRASHTPISTARNRFLVDVSETRAIRIWDLQNGALWKEIDEEPCSRNAIAVSPDGRYILAASWKSVRVWDIDTGQRVSTLGGHRAEIISLAAIPGTSLLISGSRAGRMRIWDFIAGGQVACLEGHNLASGINSIAVTQDGRYAFSGADDGKVLAWDLSDHRTVASLEGHLHTVSTMAVSPDGNYVISGGGKNDTRILVWDVKRCLQAGRSEAGGPNRGVSMTTPGGEYEVFEQGDGLRARDLATGELLSPSGLTTKGRLLEVTSRGRTILLRQAIPYKPSGSKVHKYGGDPDSWTRIQERDGFRWTAMAISMEEKYLAFGCSDGNIRIMDNRTGDIIRVMGAHAHPVTALMITPDNRKMISMGDDRIKIWDFERGELLGTIGDLNRPIRLTPDGETIIARSRSEHRRTTDNSLKVLNLKTGGVVHRLEGHRTTGNVQDLVSGLAVTRDGRYLISCAGDRTLRVWDLSTGECMTVFRGEGAFRTCETGPRTEIVYACYKSGGGIQTFSLENIPFGPTIITVRDGKARCPACGGDLPVAKQRLGSVITCPACQEQIKYNDFTVSKISREALLNKPKSLPRTIERRELTLSDLPEIMKSLKNPSEIMSKNKEFKLPGPPPLKGLGQFKGLGTKPGKGHKKPPMILGAQTTTDHLPSILNNLDAKKKDQRRKRSGEKPEEGESDRS